MSSENKIAIVTAELSTRINIEEDEEQIQKLK